jgi:hypothetical protein
VIGGGWSLPPVAPTLQELASPFVGGYYFSQGQDSSGLGVLASLGVNLFRAVPWYIPAGSSPLTAVAADVTVIGDFGSSLRVAVYADNGGANPALPYNYPTTLLADVGALPTDGIAQPVAVLGSPLQVATATTGGMVWIGGALQNVTILQPTLRITSRIQAILPAIMAMAAANVVPAAGVSACGYSQAGFSGAPPATFTTALTTHSSAPRFMVRFG